MENKNYYIKKIIKTLAIAVLSGIVIPTIFKMNHSAFDTVFNLVIFSGVPTGWMLLTKILGSWVAIHPLTMIFVLMAKLFGSMFVGWIALPVTLVMDAVKLVKAYDEQEMITDEGK